MRFFKNNKQMKIGIAILIVTTILVCLVVCNKMKNNDDNAQKEIHLSETNNEEIETSDIMEDTKDLNKNTEGETTQIETSEDKTTIGFDKEQITDEILLRF